MLDLLTHARLNVGTRKQLGLTIGRQIKNLLQPWIDDYDRFLDVLERHSAAWTGAGLHSVLRADYLVDYGNVSRDPAEPIIDLVVRECDRKQLGEALKKMGWGWGMTSMLSGNLDHATHIKFLSAKSRSNLIIETYMRNSPARQLTLRVMCANEVHSRYPLALFSWCCGMRVCTLFYPAEVYPTEGLGPYPTPPLYQRLKKHFLHGAKIDTSERALDVEVRQMQATMLLEDIVKSVWDSDEGQQQ